MVNTINKRDKMSKQRKREHLINEEITYEEVRIGGNLYSLKDALKLAYDDDKDLILINERSNPPICLMQEYSKYIYELKKKEKENKSKQVIVETKELRFGPNIAQNDLMVKINQAEKFINEGNKVKFTIQFRGRENQFKYKGEDILNFIITSLENVAKVESPIKLDGKRMFIILTKK